MSSDSTPRSLSRALRVASFGGALILVVGYAVLIPLKVRGMLPPEMTYLCVIVAPALMVGMIPGYILAAMRFPNRMILSCWVVTIVIALAVLVVLLLDPALPASHP